MTYALVDKKITESMLVSSNVPEPSVGEVLWNNTDNYLAGAKGIILTSTHHRYKCLQAHAGKSPADIANIGVYWADDGPTNRWAMFDGGTSFQTSNDAAIVVVVKTGFFDSLYLAGLVGKNVSVSVTNGAMGAVIKTAAKLLEASRPDNAYDYRFMPHRPQSDYFLTDIEPYSQAHLTVTISGAGVVKCGIFAPGQIRAIGTTQYGAKASPKSYSTVVVKDGVASIRKRRAGNDLAYTCWIETSEANKVHATLMELIDVPCLWIGSDLPNYQGLRSWGLGVGTISYDFPENAQVNINVTGLIK